MRSMSDLDRAFAPSEGRILAATRAGLVPRTRLLLSAFVFFAAAGVLLFFGPHLREVIEEMLREEIRAAVEPRSPGAAVSRLALRAAWILAPLLGAVFAVTTLGTLLIFARRRSERGLTVAPLPSVPADRIARLAVRLFTILVFALFVSFRWRARFPAFYGFARGEPSAGESIWMLAVEILAGAGALMLLGGLAEYLISRASLLRALRLDNRDARRERRVEGRGGPVRDALRRRAMNGGDGAR